ncbi:MerR family DNA-binding protein [Pseudonocardia asaccharolytica]|uniref:HTH merR-type domain-containing protein n=1 Tax=Pseudonocardia asaccharolytica DSM 44247 = NBRC 16224 TaxID=1123024 RepID=A0A511CZ04_9PSEU|nr:hypothetical protein PA7_13400 [Pseudonocardia asaccharolytica DSM 44247 = NBRC 16224]
MERLALIKTLKPLDFTLEQMRELLATVDAVRNDHEDPERTGDLLGKLAMFRAAADSRIEALRAQIQGSETLSQELKSLAASSKRRSSRRRSEDGTGSAALR